MSEERLLEKITSKSVRLSWLIPILLVASILFLIFGLLIGKAAWEGQSDSAPAALPTPDWLEPLTDEITTLVRFLTEGDGRGLGYEWLSGVGAQFGNRHLGSSNLKLAIDSVEEQLKKEGFDNVHTEVVDNLPKWIRGKETAQLVAPISKSLPILGVGNTSPGSVVNALAVVVRSFEQMEALGAEAKDKIIVFNQEWKGYVDTVKYRYSADKVAKLGAKGVLIRSMTGFSIATPHTGWGAPNQSSATPIPAACITVEDAELLQSIQDSGRPIRITFNITSRYEGTTESNNVVFDIKGSEKPGEVVLLSGHFDSWDVGTGVMDDGGGCAIAYQALTALKRLGFAPKRTIRGIFWTAEEEGYLGAKRYYDKWKKERETTEKFVFVSESDMGAWKPDSLNATLQFSKNASSTEERKKLAELADFLIPMGIIFSVEFIPTKGKGDVRFWEEKEGVPGVFYAHKGREEYYFYFHHTEGDMMTVFKREDLDFSAAMFAAIAHAFANQP